MRVGLHQLAQSGATDGQVPVWDDVAGVWTPADQTGSGGGGGGGATYALDPTTLNATYGDHFTGTDLDTAKWTRGGSYVDADDETAATTWLKVAARGAGSYYYQTAPSGDYSVVAKFTTIVTGTAMFGVMLVNNSGNGVGGGFYNSAPNQGLLGTVVSGAYTSGFVQGGNPGTGSFEGPQFWVKVRKSGTNYYLATSVNGQFWSAETTALSNANTPTRIGFGTFLGSGVVQFGIDFFDVQ